MDLIAQLGWQIRRIDDGRVCFALLDSGDHVARRTDAGEDVAFGLRSEVRAIGWVGAGSIEHRKRRLRNAVSRISRYPPHTGPDKVLHLFHLLRVSVRSQKDEATASEDSSLCLKPIGLCGAVKLGPIGADDDVCIGR